MAGKDPPSEKDNNHQKKVEERIPPPSNSDLRAAIAASKNQQVRGVENVSEKQLGTLSSSHTPNQSHENRDSYRGRMRSLEQSKTRGLPPGQAKANTQNAINQNRVNDLRQRNDIDSDKQQKGRQSSVNKETEQNKEKDQSKEKSKGKGRDDNER